MFTAHEEATRHKGQREELRSLITNLSVLLAMAYRRAPLPISANLVRWFANQSGPETAFEMGSVLRHCLLLGDEALVVGELRKHALQAGKVRTVLSKGSGNNAASTIDLNGPRNEEEWIANR